MTTSAPVTVADIRLEAEGSDVVLSGRVRAPGLDLPPTLWYRFDAALAPFLSVNGDPFLPPLLMVAMKTGRPLVIEGDCSARLLGSAAGIMALFHQWAVERGDRMDAVEVVARHAVRERPGAASGAFFSGGVDSLYTLLRNLDRYPEGHAGRITHLILVHGFDIRLEQSRLFETVSSQAAQAAEALGIVLIPSRTNARETLRGVSWLDYGYGPALCAVGLALGGLLRTIYVGSSSAGQVEASHPDMDPRWSTECLRFAHDASEVTRLGKIRLIATSRVGLDVLRVCWENPDGAYNCGRCEKCLRTMVGLSLCGGLGRARGFPQALALEAVGRLSVQPSSRPFWTEMLAEARSTGQDALAAAIEGAIARGTWAETRLGRLDRGWWRLAEKAGLSPAAFKRVDSALFGGMGTRSVRWLQRRFALRRGRSAGNETGRER